MDRDAFWCATTGASRFDVLLPSRFLVSQLPTVLDLRQQLSKSLNIPFTPSMHADATELDRFRCGYLLGGDVAAQCGCIETQLFGNLACRESRHRLQV